MDKFSETIVGNLNLASNRDCNHGVIIRFMGYKLVYLNGNNAAEGENNFKYANSYPMN